MSDRSELAKIYVETLNRGHGMIERSEQGKQAADAIIAAGYRKPKVVPDEHLRCDENGAYPVRFKKGTIVESADGSVWRFDEGDWDSLGWGSASLRGPAIVRYEPGARR